MVALSGIAPLAHAGTVGLILELAAAFGIVAIGLAAWLGSRKERP